MSVSTLAFLRSQIVYIETGYNLTFTCENHPMSDIIPIRGIAMIRIHLSTLLGKKRWTQAKLSVITGIRPNTINEYYHELCTRINLDHLDLICEALDCSLEELISREANQEPRIERTKTGQPVRPIKD